MFLRKADALLVVVLLTIGACMLWSQDATQSPAASDQTQQSSATSSQQTSNTTEVSVTGCLKTGDQGGEYSVVGQDGKKYGLWASGKVKLDEHVGQVVTVTGRRKNPTKGDPDESAAVTVTGVKRVSDNCP
jgi:hypothetical protein